jgi:starch phosphorylase
MEANSLYNKLEKVIAPHWSNPNAWARLQQHCIGINGTFFNTQRMLGQYFSNAYFPSASSRFQLEPSADAEEGFGLTETAFVPVNKA